VSTVAASYDDEVASPTPDHAPASPLTRLHGVLLVVLGGAGLAAAFSLAVDKYRILENPDFSPSCDLSPILSCGSVMVTDQGSAFGFPNPVIGLMAFAVVVTLGVLVASGTALPRWVLGGLAGGSLLGVVFVHWLAFQSMYRIGALCPWCLVVWTVTLAIFVWTALLFLRAVPALSGAGEALWSVRYLVLTFWYLGFVVAALVQFWDYWRTLL
jgi:uncharacterized membrane protein